MVLAAILGMHSIITRPIAIDQDTIEKVGLVGCGPEDLVGGGGCVDGKEAVGFLKTIKELIENPERLIIRILIHNTK
ncbi:2-oxo acid dehydrogenase subunit E2 [Staphylococcus aureus]